MNTLTITRRTCIALALAASYGVQAQSYPTKPITFVVPFSAGSATDVLARALGQGVTAETKQNIITDNRPGASGIIAAQLVAKAAPDGYTVIIATNTTHAANAHLFKKLPYDAVKDFSPVTTLARGGQVLVVNPSVPVQNRQENLSPLAKRQPGKLPSAVAVHPAASQANCSSRWPG